MKNNDSLKAVLVGCGGISQAWLQPLQAIPEVQIVGLVDLAAENARQRAAEFGLDQVQIGTKFEKILAETQPDIVFDCAVPGAHHDITLTALAAGCHVLGEKPLAESMAHAREMVAAAQHSQKFYAVMQNRRYLEPVRRIRQFLDAGALGPLTTVNCDFYLAPHFGGFRDQMAHVLLLDMAIHTFDQARFMAGCNPQAVYCKEWNPAGSWYAHGASAMAVFEMTAGVVYNYRGSWCAEGLQTAWEAEWRFVGTHGTLKWDGAEGFAAETATQTGEFWSELQLLDVPPFDRDPLIHGHASCIREFIDCVQTGVEPNTICTDNLHSLAMVFSAIESAETGQQIAIEV